MTGWAMVVLGRRGGEGGGGGQVGDGGFLWVITRVRR